MEKVDFPEWPELKPEETYKSFQARPLPPPEPGEISADPFERQKRVPGHDQAALDSEIVLVGGGGLNSWIGLGLVRSGAKAVTVIDPDAVDLTNLPRQLFYAENLGDLKGTALAANLVAHSTAGARIAGIAMYFQEAVEQYALPCDLLVVGVDNNLARLVAARYARIRRIPAVFVALSKNGMRVNALLQGRWDHNACWHCAQPNIDPDEAAPCVPAVISGCFLAAASAIFMCHRALMGWPDFVEPYNWRDTDLLGINPDITGNVHKRSNCPTCGGV